MQGLEVKHLGSISGGVGVGRMSSNPRSTQGGKRVQTHGESLIISLFSN